MFNDRLSSARALGDRPRRVKIPGCAWPKVSVWHGSADPTVRQSNAEEIVGQWLNVHGLSAVPLHVENLTGHLRRVWHDANGEAMIEASSGMPQFLSPSPGPFFLAVGISSSYYIAKFWGLANIGPQPRSAPREAWTGPLDGALSGEVEIIARVSAAAVEAMDRRFEWHENHRTHSCLDPNVVIAEAFRAAGLPPPESNIHPGASPVVPGPIIEAALKAAGLMPR